MYEYSRSPEGRDAITLLDELGLPMILRSKYHALEANLALTSKGVLEVHAAARRFGFDRAGFTFGEVDAGMLAGVVHEFLGAVWPFANFWHDPAGGGAIFNVYCWGRGLRLDGEASRRETERQLRDLFESFAVRLVVAGNGPDRPGRVLSVGLRRAGGRHGAGCEREYRRARQGLPGWTLVPNSKRLPR